MKCTICGRGADLMACQPCQNVMTRQLNDLVTFYALASGELIPGIGGDGRSTERGIGVRVEALDFIAGNVIVEVLESWERDWRESFGLGPFGPASAARSAGAANQPATRLTEVCRFLRVWLPKAAVEHPAIDDFAGELRGCWREAQRAANQLPRTTWRVACPTDECAAPISVGGQDLDGAVTCKKCRTLWSVDRLLLIVAAESEGAIWMDPETCAMRAGVDERTLRRWANAGKITKRQGRYDYKSIRQAITASK